MRLIRPGNHNGETVLHLAVPKGRLAISKIFIKQAGAKIELADGKGYTAFRLAAQNGHIDIMDYLLGEGVPVDRTVTPKNVIQLDPCVSKDE